ncbi:hypothetical protein PVK06_019878 [Gossypium arboreum]|uniref:Uncharacterized protein n=1 Tax=Gossypium arboreum TaxID=29729 RepID=A0ABR0PKX8_GOSAR|nr:hypothetical protein PVK06_019878 [Gossypium arboreum]
MSVLASVNPQSPVWSIINRWSMYPAIGRFAQLGVYHQMIEAYSREEIEFL